MVQRRAARFVCRDYRRETGVVSSLLEKLGWQTLQEHRKVARSTLFYKIVNKHVSVDTGNVLRASTRNTRCNSALSPAFINIQTTKNLRIFLFPSNCCRLESTLPSNSWCQIGRRIQSPPMRTRSPLSWLAASSPPGQTVHVISLVEFVCLNHQNQTVVEWCVPGAKDLRFIGREFRVW